MSSIRRMAAAWTLLAACCFSTATPAAAPPSTAGCPLTRQQFVSAVNEPVLGGQTRAHPLVVSGAGAWLHDLDVTVTLPHGSSRDIDLQLVSPSGTVVPFARGVGKDSTRFVVDGTLFDDQAPAPIDFVTTRHNVRLRAAAPNAALAAFIGENPNGTWKLLATSRGGPASQGLLVEWRLEVTSTEGRPPSTRSVSSATLQTELNDLATAVFAQDIVGLPAHLVDLDVFVDLPHDAPPDLDLVLSAPSGRSVVLVADKGTAATDNIFAGTTFDDGALRRAAHFTAVDEQVEALLVPQQPLASLIGDSPNGRWLLRVTDDSGGTGTRGMLRSWSLAFTVAEPEAICTASGLSVSSAAPTSASTNGGTPVTVNGSGFTPAVEVLFGGVPSPNVTVLGPTQLFADAPSSQTVGPVGLTVRLPGGAATLDRGFNYLGPQGPTLSSVQTTAADQGYSLVTVAGANFAPEGRVLVDGVVAPTWFSSDTEATFLAPAHPYGSAEVQLINPDGRDSGTGTLLYLSSAAPDFTLLTPNSGPVVGNVRVLATGINFVPGMTITVGGRPATGVRVHSPTRAEFIPPPGQFATAYEAHIFGPAGSGTNLFHYTYLAESAPVVLTASPRGGPVDGGFEVVVTGRGFSPATVFTVDGVVAPSTFVDPLTAVINPPPHDPGVVALVASNSLDAGPLDGGFVYGALGPYVSSVSPIQGPSSGGTTVVIDGANFFGLGPTGPSVRFGDRAAGGVTLVSDTRLTAVTPAQGAGFAPIQVVNPDLQVGELLGAFEYLGPPRPLSVTPPVGPADGGNTVVIAGSGFSTTGITSVRFATRFATGVVVQSPTQLTAIVPAQASVDPQPTVTVINPGGAQGSLVGGYLYADEAPLSLTSLSPVQGALDGGYPVTLTGNGFVPGTTVAIGGSEANNVVISSPQQLTFTAPAGAVGGPKDLTVVTPEGQERTLPSAFDYLVQNDRCALAEVVPANGLPFLSAPNRQVFFASDAGDPKGSCTVLSGANHHSTWYAFTPGTTGRYQFSTCDSDAPANDTSDDALTLFTSANGCAGPFEPLSPGGCFNDGCAATGGAPAGNVRQGANLQAGTTYYALVGHAAGSVTRTSVVQLHVSRVPTPVFDGITPGEGPAPGGGAFAITGQNFGPTATVAFGGTSALSVSVDGGIIFGTTPPLAPGIHSVVVSTAGQSGSVDGGFTSVEGPSLSAVAPNVGVSIGGETVALSGLRFADVASVRFGGAAAQLLPGGTPTGLMVVTPPHPPGPVEVVVTNGDGQQATLPDGFGYLVGPGTAPVVSGVSPDAGSSLGGTVVLIEGAGFSTAGPVAVSFGGTPATAVQVFSAMALSATTAPHLAGVVDVVVTNPDFQTGTASGAFAFLGPALSDFTPRSGPADGGTAVRIVGGPFVPGLQVRFGSAAAVVTSFDAGVIDVTSPPGSGEVLLSVLSTDGSVATSATPFRYLAAPFISDLAPRRGPSGGGTEVVVSGGNFEPGASVSFGLLPAAVITASPTELKVRAPPSPVGEVAVRVTNPDGQFATDAFLYERVDPEDAGSDGGASGDPTDGGARFDDGSEAGGETPPRPPRGCGCDGAAGFDLLALALTGWAIRSRRNGKRRPSTSTKTAAHPRTG